jgi:tetratricopeptide (TPR) repeat protein
MLGKMNKKKLKKVLWIPAWFPHENDTQLGNFYFQKAQVLSILERYDEALVATKTAFELEEDFLEARKVYALVALKTGDRKLAQDILSPVYDTLAVDDDRFINFFVAEKDYKLVAQIWQMRTEKEPANIQAWTNWAVSLYFIGQKSEATEVIREAIKVNPTFKEEGEKIIGAIADDLIKLE